jgi:hypothetical protein
VFCLPGCFTSECQHLYSVTTPLYYPNLGEGTCSSKTLVSVFQAERVHNLGDLILKGNKRFIHHFTWRVCVCVRAWVRGSRVHTCELVWMHMCMRVVSKCCWNVSINVRMIDLQGRLTVAVGTEGPAAAAGAGDKAQTAGSRELATVEEVNIATLNYRDRCRGAFVRRSDSLQLLHESSLRRETSVHVDGSVCCACQQVIFPGSGLMELILSGSWIVVLGLTIML